LSVVRCQLQGKITVARTNFENLHVYRLAEALADDIWRIVSHWPQFAKDTIGKQLVRAADSIGANIAEGAGRRAFQDNRRYVRIARGSLNETQHWLRRAFNRELLGQKDVERLRPMVDELAPRLNAYMKSIGVMRQGKPIPDNGQRTTDN
jgi:four helix bundle protein